jgi:diphosphomevalonate decarboxylase
MKEIRSSEWVCPSNIALIKYWGKRAGQIPRNPSLSFSLSEAFSRTRVAISERTNSPDFSLDFTLDGANNERFAARVLTYLGKIQQDLPWVNDFAFEISTTNSFPHSSGIASSASGFGALALCLADLDAQVTDRKRDFFPFSSYLARLGSGSASRSVFPGFSVWGKAAFLPGSNNLYALPLTEASIHPLFRNIRDTIVVVNTGEKSTSSTQGHLSMDKNPFAQLRYRQARRNLHELIHTLEKGDWIAFVSIIEQEAFALHAMMMTGSDPFFLFEPETLTLIRELWKIRAQEKLAFGITLDAGPNLHIIHPPELQAFIRDAVEAIGVEKGFSPRFILDGIGSGPLRLESA